MANIPTPEQRDIIKTLDTPLFVEAGAGSGKSATLAERVAWALTPGSGGDENTPYIDSLDQVLVITYTHAAADEIRERIRARLRRDERLAHHALEVDAAWISTIHGMCIRILKSHAFELGLDPELALINETRAEELLEKAVDRCVGTVATAPEYAELRSAFEIRGRSAVSGDAGNTVISMVKSLRNAAASGVAGFDSLEFPGISKPLAEKLASYLDACRFTLGTIDEVGFKSNKTNDAAYAELAAQISAIEQFLAGPDHSDSAAADLIGGFGALSGSAFRSNDLKDTWRELRDELAALMFSKELIGAAPVRTQLVRLAQKVDAEYAAAKRALGKVDNNDLLRMAHRTFEEHPEIAALYSHKFKLVMVDEFQDTNEQQVQMISRLSGDHGEHLATVGDAQQSIYRFQGADVTVFTNRGEHVDTACHRSLTVNFRSHADILSFVEKVCAGGIIGHFMPLKPSDVRKDTYKTSQLPRIAIELTSGPHGSDGERRAVSAQQLAGRIKAYLDAGGSAGDVVVLMGSLSHVQIYLDALRALGIECVVSGGSSFTGTPEVALVAALVDVLANPYATSSGLYPVLTSEIFYCDANDICLLATRDHEPRDEHDARAYDKRQLAEGFFALVRGDEDGICKGGSPSERLLLAAEVMGRAFARLRSWRLCDVLEGIVRESGWIARLEEQGPQGIAQAANVLAAIRYADELADEGGFGISRASREFADWLRIARKGLASLDTGASGVVRVMTVHASKGLEFPVCAVAELWGSSRNSGGAIVSENVGSSIFAALIPKDASKYLADEPEPPAAQGGTLEDWASYLAYLSKTSEQAERGRLLYVALTRAKEALILCASVKVTKDANAYGTNWGPQLVSDTCSALFGRELPAAGLSQVDYGGSAPALVRHVVLSKGKDDEDFTADGAGAFEFAPIVAEPLRTVDLFETSVDDGIAQTRAAERPWHERSGTFSYSSVHALMAEYAAEQDGEDVAAPAKDSSEVFRRPIVIAEEEEGEGMPAPSLDDDDKATNLGSAFHQLAQTMVECGEIPSKERIDAASRTWQLSRRQRARLGAALDRWASSALRAETLGYSQRRAEVPFFIAVDSEYGTHLEGAIDLLCTNPGSTHALVVDYKTGDAGLTYEQIEERHAMQANFYASVLARLGYESIECAFVCVELMDGFGEPVVARYRFESSNIHSLF